MNEFHEGLADILEVELDEIGAETILEEGQWDLLAIVSTIALIDEVYDRQVSADALAECKTVGDIEKLAQAEG